ncbi:ScbR family autoregulator-binding transcription factor [Streptomyces sp. NBC_00572]|uniref:ScbR family autoregulator-binding transcription factor n=1 Tax=Streptomyces sp. NBC_00572 TaxID=2903664 RepID=UPI002255D7ED|nr:ScbR family autoregulator-binding transcription factor [Streptomyces sp. NBC_00572]MCX4987057.1 ScbR family autoregulator-binding transcription factor [Streptomyces sp. NBC_00572]
MAQQERAIRTRRIILEAAAEMFDERGYESTTIAEILERADVTKGALYFHFPSKSDLARGVLAAAVTTDGVRPQELKLQEMVDTLLLLAYRLPREPMLSAALRMAVDLQSRRQFGTAWPDWTELLAGFLKDAKGRGEVLPYVDEADIARMIVSTWTGVRVVSEGLPGTYDLAAEIALLLQLLLHAITTPAVLPRLEISAARAAHLYDDMPAWRATSEAVGAG